MFLFSNQAKSTLAASINTAATSLTLQAGTGISFPSPTGGDKFALTLADAATGQIYEIVYCTARAGDVLTVVRAQESTSALNWNSGDFANLLITKGTAEAFTQFASPIGTMALQNANAVAITGGDISGVDLTGSSIPVVDVAGVGTMAVQAKTITTKGDLLVGGVAGALARLPAGTDGFVLTSRSSATNGLDFEPASAGGNPPALNPQTGTAYTLALTDAPAASSSAGIVTMNNAAANAVTVTKHATVAWVGQTQIMVAQLGAGQTSLVADTGVTILNASSLNARAQNSVLLLTYLGSDVWLLSGDMQ